MNIYRAVQKYVPLNVHWFFRLSFEQKQNWLLGVQKQSILSVWAKYSISCFFLIYRYILQDLWNYQSLTRTRCMLWWRKLYTRTMPFTYEEKCFAKIYRTICMAPTAQTWARLITLYIRALQQSMSHSDFQHLRSQRHSEHHGRMLTNLLINGVTNWRLWFDWMMDILNSYSDYLVHLLSEHYNIHVYFVKLLKQNRV